MSFYKQKKTYKKEQKVVMRQYAYKRVPCNMFMFYWMRPQSLIGFSQIARLQIHKIIIVIIINMCLPGPSGDVENLGLRPRFPTSPSGPGKRYCMEKHV